MRKIKAKRKAGGDVLQREQEATIQKTRERVAGEKGKKYSELSLSARQAIDKRVQKQAGIVNKLATKLLPSVKKKELERVKRARTNEELALAEGKTEVRQDLQISKTEKAHSLQSIILAI